MMGFKTKVSHFKVKNLPLKDTNGKGEFKRMFSQFFVVVVFCFFKWTKEGFSLQNFSFEEFEVFLHGGAFCLF